MPGRPASLTSATRSPTCSRGNSPALARDGLARGVEDEGARGREPAADHHELRVEDVDERPDAGAETAPDPVEDLDRALLAFVREPDEPVRVDGRTEDLLREL